MFLAALTLQVDGLEKGLDIDYDIMRGVAEYFTEYADPVHHPLEDAVLAKLRARAPQAAEEVGALEEEHRRLDAELSVFTDAVNAILNEEELPRDRIVQAIRRFITDQRRHVALEEALFFSAAEKELTAEDWAAIDRDLQADAKSRIARDPAKFDALRRAIAAG